MERGIKTVISFFIFLFSWSCMLEESPPEISSSGEQPRNGLALFFEQKLEARLRTRSGELEMFSESRTPLTEHVRYGYSPVYGGHYFIVPLRQESTGQIDAGLVYPLTNGDDLTLSGDLDTPLLLDEAALNAVPDSCRFLLSNKFLSWKKGGLSVSRSLYAYAESLDGKSIFTPFDKSSAGTSSNTKMPSTRSVEEYPYEASVIIHYDIQPWNYVEDDEIIISLPSLEARRDAFLSALNYLGTVNGVGECELLTIEMSYLALQMYVSDESVVEEAVECLIQTAVSSFQAGYINNLSYFYRYILYRNGGVISEEEGSGEGGGSTGGGSTPSNPGESGSKSYHRKDS